MLAQPILCPAMIGRSSDLTALVTLLDTTRQGSGKVILLTGEAGIGKSRLATEIKTLSVVQGFRSLQGNCFSTDLHCPYAPLSDLLHMYLYTLETPAIVAEIGPLARELFSLLPEYAQSLFDLAALPPLPKLEAELEKRRLFSALTRFLLQGKPGQPVLLLLEDLHWCDDLSLEFLHYLARQSLTHPLLLLLTYRNDEVRPLLKHWLAQLERMHLVHEFTLSRLTRTGVDAMLRAIFQQSRPPTKALVDAIYTLTEGNPFFVEETLKSLMTTGDLSYHNDSWQLAAQSEPPIPRSVQDMLQQRVEQLSEAAHQTLILAAVAGRRFDFALLQALTGYAESQLVSVVKELIGAQLIHEENAEQFAFRHALTRQAVYAELLVRERRKLHGQIAETLEQSAGALSDAYLSDLSTHFFLAENWPKALVFAQKASTHALALHATEAACEHLIQAIEAAQHLDQPTPPELLLARGQCYETLGNFDQARTDYEYSLQRSRAAQNRELAWQSLLKLGFLWSERDYMQGGRYYQQAIKLAHEIDDPILIAHSLNRLGNWHLNREEPLDAIQEHREALAIFEAKQQQQGIAETLDLLGMASYLSGHLSESTTYYQQALPLFQQQNGYKEQINILGTLIICGSNYQATTLIVPDVTTEQIIHYSEQGLKLAQEIGQRSGETYIFMNLGFSLGPRGLYGQALEYLKRGSTIAREIQHHQWLAGISCARGALYADLLILDEARMQLESARALASAIGSQFWLNLATGLLASICIASKDPAQAEFLLRAVHTDETPIRTIGQRMLWYSYGMFALSQGEAHLALQISEKLDTANNDSAHIPTILKLRGEALAQLKQYPEAAATLQTALTAAQDQGLRSLQWRIQLALSKVYKQQRRTGEMVQIILAAQANIDELGTSLTDEKIRETFIRKAKRLFPTLPELSPRRVEKQAFEGLTQREREIATLIAHGKYNREIAEELVIGERTVETHISNIMFKLNFTSRRQIAHWAEQKGLSADKE